MTVFAAVQINTYDSEETIDEPSSPVCYNRRDKGANHATVFMTKLVV